jgi:hypothetical protein
MKRTDAKKLLKKKLAALDYRVHEQAGHDLLVGDNGINGEVSVRLLDKLIPASQIRDILGRNALTNHYTLFIVDHALLPDEGTTVVMNEMFAAIHATNYGRVYTYQEDEGDIQIISVHFEPIKDNFTERMVMYEAWFDLDIDTVDINSSARVAKGFWKTATFGEGPYWKRGTGAKKQQKQTRNKDWSYQQHEYSHQDRDWGGWDQEHTRQWYEEMLRKAYEQRRQTPPPRRYNGYVSDASYAVLGVTKDCTKDEVKAAYRKLAKENHPDLHPDEKAKYTEKMALINVAYEDVVKAL